MIDTKQVIALVEQMQYVMTRLEAMPQVIPLAREILRPVFPRTMNGGNGSTRTADAAPAPRLPRTPRPLVKTRKPKRHLSAAQKLVQSKLMKARWAKARKAGKTSLENGK